MVANSPELISLANNALNYGIDIVRDSGGDITPFVMVESDNGITLSHFASDRLEISIR